MLDGAALFPSDSPLAGDLDCPTGEEVFSTRQGDPSTYAIAGKTGPRLTSLIRTLDQRVPYSGSTPTSARISSSPSARSSTHSPGKTYVFLLTDGAPNCNATRKASACTVNIEGECVPSTANCCDPAFGFDVRACLDSDRTISAVTGLRLHGIETFIIGMPGTSAYADLLDQLAIAGGNAAPDRASVLLGRRHDGSDRSVDGNCARCRRELRHSARCRADGEEPGGVHFDEEIILEQDPDNGWIWSERLPAGELVGESCRRLKAGDVIQVQVAAGCTTIWK